MSGQGLEAFCLEPSYIEAFDILNLPSFANPASIRLSSNLSWLAISNVTIYIDSPAFILLQNFSYASITSLPLSKPLAIQCPVAACIFPISGYFTLLQRVLLYINICVATFALHVPLLRGVSQIWLTTFWFSVLAMFLATMVTTKIPMIYNLDLQPAVLVVHIGLLPTLLWFSFRGEPGDPRQHAVRAGDSEEREEVERSEHSDYEDLGDDVARGGEANFAHDAEEREDAEHPEGLEDPPVLADAGSNASEVSWWKKHVLNFPVTRILVPAYALFDLANVIMANIVQNSAGFWPTATAVIVSNGTNYLLTSPCFQDSTGYVGLWPPYPFPYNGIRNINNSLSIFYPPPGTKATDAMQAVPRTDITILHCGSVFICFMICILSLTRLSWLEESLGKMFSQLEAFLHLRLNKKQSQYRDSMIRYLAILPFLIPLLGAVIITLYVIIVFEYNSHRVKLPENEAYTEIGQWGPFVVVGLVFTATLLAKINGWDFDTKDKEGEKRAFGWLLGGDRSKSHIDESEERRGLFQPSQDNVIPLSVLSEARAAREPIRLDLRRGSQAP